MFKKFVKLGNLHLISNLSSDLEHFHKFHSPSATRTASQSTNMSRVLGSGWHNANTTAKIEFRKKLWETPSPRRSERSSLRRYSVNTQRERIQRLRRELVLCPSPERISSSSPQINLFSHDDTSIFAWHVWSAQVYYSSTEKLYQFSVITKKDIQINWNELL